MLQNITVKYSLPLNLFEIQADKQGTNVKQTSLINKK